MAARPSKGGFSRRAVTEGRPYSLSHLLHVFSLSSAALYEWKSVSRIILRQQPNTPYPTSRRLAPYIQSSFLPDVGDLHIYLTGRPARAIVVKNKERRYFG